MIIAFIKLRFMQILRTANGIGLLRFIFLLGLIAFIAFGIFMLTAEVLKSFYVSAICIFIITLIQIKRSDAQFLKINFIHFKLIYLTEYLLLMMPLFFCLCFHKQWTSIVSVVASTLLIINIDYSTKRKSLNTFIQRVIPLDCFEWKGGVRSTLVLIIIVWTIGLVTSFFVASVPVALFILGILPLNFNEKNEPLPMILSYERGTNSFLLHKIKLQIVLYTILCIPLIASFIFFFSDLWYIPLIVFFFLIISHLYIILTNFAFYKPINKSKVSQTF